MGKKAQISTLDFLTAVFVFTLALAYAVGNLNTASVKVVSETDYKYMIMTAVEISDVLVKNEGFPSFWNTTNIEVPGLASDDRIISSSKLDQLCNISQNKTRSMLKIPYYVNFLVTGNRTVECGNRPNGTKVVVIRRNIFFENKNGVLEVTVWR